MVTVMMPCYQAAATLPTALASLRVQTMRDWRCVCVDDGSTDETWKLLREAAQHDGRFEVHRFPQNRGRGAARQFLLERVETSLLAFLDADDWMFPTRLDQQVRRLTREPELAAIGSPMVIFDEDEKAVGLAPAYAPRPGMSSGTFDVPVPPGLNFPASMIRADLARRVGFDERFLRSQDSDMLLRALLGRRVAVLDAPVYAYRRAAMTLPKTLDGYRFRIRAHAKHLRDYPSAVAPTIAKTLAKMLAYRVAGLVGQQDRLMDRRYGAMTREVEQAYRAAHSIVEAGRETAWTKD